jgi:3,4-dihydroxy 2-butanone 4-phosphate synthase/GTP cyclohydrolase II
MFSRVEAAIKAFRERKFCIIFSEEENEADLCIPAAGVTAEAILTMARVASGLLCLALPKKRLEELQIDKLPSRYRVQDTPFYESVDAVGVGSGISPKDRATTIRRVIDPSTRPEDLSRPGHLQLLGACDSIMERDGHTEAVVELCQLAGLYPGGILCELVSDSGEMMNARELKALAKRFKIPIITVGALAKFLRSSLPQNT